MHGQRLPGLQTFYLNHTEVLHWADGASAEAAEWLTKAAGEAPYVVLFLHRPGYEAPKGATHIELGDLGSDAVATEP